MAESLTLKKKKRFLEFIQGIERQKILFCPIDVSKDFHVAIFHDIDCQPLSEFFDFSSSKLGFEIFVNRLDAIIQQRQTDRVFVGMEPTNVYYENLLYNLYHQFHKSEHPQFELCVVDPGAVCNNRRQHSLPYKKNDQIDCASIGELLSRGLYTPAHYPRALTLEIKELSRLLKRRKAQLTALWNQMLVRVERVFPNLLIDYKQEKPLCKTPVDSKLFHNVLHLCPDPYQILSMTPKDLIELFHANSQNLGPKNSQRVHQAAQRALLLPEPYQKVHLRLFHRELKLIDYYRQEIDEITVELEGLVQQTPARHLATIPGCSPKLAAHFLAAVEEWDRFPSIQQLWATAGFSTKESQSGKSVKSDPKVSKAGCPYLRQAIYLMTTSMVWHEPTFGIPCFERLLQEKPFIPAIIHVGRKIANTALAILKTDQPFQSRFSDLQAAKQQLQGLQARYLANKSQA